MSSSEDLPWLAVLNPAQRSATQWDPHGSLQILAGPGSGKTRVLTSRVAYLVQHTRMNPSDLVIVTFTNKAANEMKSRLHDLLGGSLAHKIENMGTFHSVCVKFLRKHGSKVGLNANWALCDRDQQIAYCKALLSQPALAAKNADLAVKLKPTSLLNYVSKRKSTGQGLKAHKGDSLMADLYQAYQAALKDDNCLDFDDLLIHGEELFRRHPQVISNVKHVLIDEFQGLKLAKLFQFPDTNLVQYEMMRNLAHCGAVTVVGDPDQGIYGWRSAEVGNFQRMILDLPNTKQIFLEENYRSSSRILGASLSVVQQDPQRIDKNLFTTRPDVSLPVLRPFFKPQEESEFIAQEIHRVIAHTGGQLSYNDFSVLLRYNALSRSVEAALQSAGIPSRMVGGHKFFDRAEVKDILAYLQLADNPTFVPAFERIINVPKRAIGFATVKAVKEAARAAGLSPMAVLTRSARGTNYPALGQTHRAKFKAFLAVIFKIQLMAKSGSSIVEMIDTLLSQIDYGEYLKRTYGPDSDQRLLNIEELKAFAVHLDGRDVDVSTPPSSAEVKVVQRKYSEDILDDMMMAIVTESPREDEEPTALRRFLTESMLSTDTESDDSILNENKPKVTISTCHSSKGLEWPVVFIPAVEDGTFPFYRCTDSESIKEERRLLFVAMTRAQGLLYMSHCHQRMAGAENRDQTVSRFVVSLPVAKTKPQSLNDAKFAQFAPELNLGTREQLSEIFGRPIPSQAVVDAAIEKYNQTPRKDFRIPQSKATDKDESGYSSSIGSQGRWGSRSQLPAGVGTGKYGFNRLSSKPVLTPVGRFVSISQPTTSKNAGFSSAFTLYQSQSTTMIGPSSQVPSAAFIPQIPRGPFLKAGVEALPEARLSRGAEPTLLTSGFARTRNAAPTNSSLAGFEASSSSFMDDLKRSIPPDGEATVETKKKKTLFAQKPAKRSTPKSKTWEKCG